MRTEVKFLQRHCRKQNPCQTLANLGRALTENGTILQTNSFSSLPQKVQWRITPPSLRYSQSNGLINVNLGVCRNVNESESEGQILTLRLHESEIQHKSNQRFFFLAASRLVITNSRLYTSCLMDRKPKIA